MKNRKSNRSVIENKEWDEKKEGGIGKKSDKLKKIAHKSKRKKNLDLELRKGEEEVKEKEKKREGGIKEEGREERMMTSGSFRKVIRSLIM